MEKQINPSNSIYCSSCFDPIFDYSDVYIYNNEANTTAGSSSHLGRSFEHPQPDQGESFQAGSNPFQLSEFEVYQKEKKKNVLIYFCFFIMLSLLVL